MKTTREIEESVYQHGPLDFDGIEEYAQGHHAHDPINPVTITADALVILLECRKELMLRDIDHEYSA